MTQLCKPEKQPRVSSNLFTITTEQKLRDASTSESGQFALLKSEFRHNIVTSTITGQTHEKLTSVCPF